MNKTLLCTTLATMFIACGKSDDTKRLKSYLSAWGHDIRNFKIVCFVPVDGCVSCINPFLDYSKDSEDCYLLVLNSIYEKSIKHAISIKGLDSNRILSDAKILGIVYGLVDAIYPSVYFIKEGSVISVVNASTVPDKTVLFNEMNRVLSDAAFPPCL
jgi:hypothetical protein